MKANLFSKFGERIFFFEPHNLPDSSPSISINCKDRRGKKLASNFSILKCQEPSTRITIYGPKNDTNSTQCTFLGKTEQHFIFLSPKNVGFRATVYVTSTVCFDKKNDTFAIAEWAKNGKIVAQRLKKPFFF